MSFPLSEVVLTSSTDDQAAMTSALSDPRFGLEMKPAEPAAAPPAQEEKPSSAPPEEKPGESKTAAASEPAVPQGEVPDDENESEEVTIATVREALPKGVQRKLDRLTRQKYEARGKLAAEQARVAELEKQLAATKEKPAGQPDKPAETKPAATAPGVAEIPEPKEEDFPDDYGAWVRAHSKWTAAEAVKTALAESDKKIKDLEQKLEVARTSDKQTAIADEIWSERVEQARAVETDFDEIMSRPEVIQMPISAVMKDYIVDSDLGPRVMLHLAKNPAEAAKLVEATKLSDKPTPAEVAKAIRVAARELGRIEDKITAAAPVVKTEPAAAKPPEPPAAAPAAPAPAAAPPAQQRAPVSNAPPPINPVGTRSAVPVSDPTAMSPSDYLKWREKNPPR